MADVYARQCTSSTAPFVGSHVAIISRCHCRCAYPSMGWARKPIGLAEGCLANRRRLASRQLKREQQRPRLNFGSRFESRRDFSLYSIPFRLIKQESKALKLLPGLVRFELGEDDGLNFKRSKRTIPSVIP